MNTVYLPEEAAASMDFSEDGNPYSPPAAGGIPPVPPEVAFIQNDNLVVPVGWQSPPICILTGKTVDLLPHRKAFLWANPWAISVISAFFLYQLIKGNNAEFALMLSIWIIACVFRRKDFVSFYIHKFTAKIYKLKQAINWTITVALFVFYLEFSKYPYGFFIFASGMGMLALFQMWSFRIANVRWKRLWLGGVPHGVMKTIVRMDEEKAASRATPFPAPRFNFKS